MRLFSRPRLGPPSSSSPQDATAAAATAGSGSAPAELGTLAHRAGVARLRASFAAVPPDQTVRLAKSTSNLFRARAQHTAPGLDVSGLAGVITVDPVAKTADVQGMCTYETLVDVTLRYGLLPYVVPQLKTITLGGAVTGLGIESSSFRLGLPHESVLEMDVLTGTGDIVTARPDGTEAERQLFETFPNSYGSLGYAVRLRIALEEVPPYVALSHVRFHSLGELREAMDSIVETQSYAATPVHYLDGVVFSATESYLILGRQTAAPGPVSDYTAQHIYYRSIQHADGVKTDRLTIRDYIWRWDTDWFWCSRAFGTQNPKIRRLWPRKYLRSSVYWKFVAADHRWDLGNRLERLKGLPPRERVVQDVEVTSDRLEEFLTWFLQEVPIEPIWLCPLRLAADGSASSHPERPWLLYPLRPGTTYVNIGFWSSAPIAPGADPAAWNRRIEEQASRLGGHKSLYSDAFYSAAEFAALYGVDHAAAVKRTTDPQGRFPTLFEKAVNAR